MVELLVSILVVLLPTEFGDHAQNARAGPDCAPQGAADLGLADAYQRIHRHLDDYQALLHRLDLHLHGPTEAGICHIQGGERIKAYGPVRTQVGYPLSPQEPDQGADDAVAQRLARR